MHRNRFIQVILTQVTAFILAANGYALDPRTHAEINHYVVTTQMDGFSLDSYLKEHLGMHQGVEEQFEGFIDNKIHTAKVWSWFREGGIREDSPWYDPNTRSRNHYHEPLNNEGFSGIGGTGWLSGESSVLWSQRPFGTQIYGGDYSWNDVRNYFFNALSATDSMIRDRHFAQTFRGLGQLMHLVQDLSVPEHARDDGHYLPAYEAWVAESENGVPNVDIFSITPIFFGSPTIGDPNPLAPVPVANLFDKNRYVWSNPDPSTTLEPGIGLSEYTNANFLSPDTMFTSRFPFPIAAQCSLVVDTQNGRQYLSNRELTSGEEVDHLAVVG